MLNTGFGACLHTTTKCYFLLKSQGKGRGRNHIYKKIPPNSIRGKRSLLKKDMQPSLSEHFVEANKTGTQIVTRTNN